MDKKYKNLKFACYTSNISMAIIANLPPILFLTFKRLYGISFSLLGTLILIGFLSQLAIDLIFSFFSHKFNISKAVKFTPILTIIGFIIYAISPIIFPNNVYIGLVIGTLIFSSASGFCEVLISPVIAAIPSDDPDREMSKLHSVYAWGAVFVVIFGTLFLTLFGQSNWQILTLILLVVPISSVFLYSTSEIPKMETPERVSGVLNMLKNKTIWIYVGAIFIGGATELNMAQWCSSYLEQALNIPKVWGDIFGVALFSIMLGIGRTLYSKIGKRIEHVLLFGAVGAVICYLTAAVTSIPVLGLIACAFTGFCASMLWPGCLIVSSEAIPTGGVFLYAMMAAGGDLGASVGPQLVGVVTDFVISNPLSQNIATWLSVSVEQLGMKCGMIVGMLFPLIGIPLYIKILKKKKSEV